MEFNEAFSPVRAIAHGFAALKRAPLSVLAGGFIMLFVALCSGGGGGGGDLGQLAEDQSPEVSMAIAMVVLAAVAVSVVVSLIGFLVRCWLLPGWLRLQAHVLEHGTDDLALLFTGGDATMRMIGWRLLHGFINFGTTLVALIPGGALIAYGVVRAPDPDIAFVGAGATLAALLVIPVSLYVSLGLSLGDQLVALDGLGPMAALERTWELADGHRLQLLLFFFILGLFTLVGVLLCFVGLFFTWPVAQIGTTEAFLLATRPGAKDWVIPREEGL